MIFLMHAEVFNSIRNSNLKSKLKNTISRWENWGQKELLYLWERSCLHHVPKDQSSWNKKMMQPKECFALG